MQLAYRGSNNLDATDGLKAVRLSKQGGNINGNSQWSNHPVHGWYNIEVQFAGYDPAGLIEVQIVPESQGSLSNNCSLPSRNPNMDVPGPVIISANPNPSEYYAPGFESLPPEAAQDLSLLHPVEIKVCCVHFARPLGCSALGELPLCLLHIDRPICSALGAFAFCSLDACAANPLALHARALSLCSRKQPNPHACAAPQLYGCQW